MKIKIVGALLVLISASCLAQIQRIDRNKPSMSLGPSFDPSDDTDALQDYQKAINGLKRFTVALLKTMGYKVSLVRRTLIITISAKKAVRSCYTNNPKQSEFHKCAREQLEKSRLQYEAVQADARKHNHPILTTISKTLDLFQYIRV